MIFCTLCGISFTIFLLIYCFDCQNKFNQNSPQEYQVMNAERDVLTTQQAAKLLGLSTTSVQKW